MPERSPIRYCGQFLLAGMLLCGCAHTPPENGPGASVGKPGDLAIRNNAASLLYDLMGDEQDVSKVLLIKKHTEALGDLIKLISSTAKDDRILMETMAGADRKLNLQIMQLPPGEAAARKSEGKSKEYDLLFTSGSEFEFNLLLTQAEALGYGWHLAKVASENSDNRAECRQFKALSQTFEDLYHQVSAQMRGSGR